IGQELDLLEVQWLLDVIKSAQFKCFHSALDRSERGHDHDRDGRIELPNSLEQLDSSDAWEPDIREHHVGVQAPEQAEGFLSVLGYLGLVSLLGQKSADGPGQSPLIVHDEYRGAVHSRLSELPRGLLPAASGSAAGSFTRTVVPWPTRLMISRRPP